MQFIKIFLCSLFLFTNSLFSQEISNKPGNIQFEFLPAGLNFMPLKAGIDEARMGILYNPENSNLKVDIGNSFDVLEFKFLAHNSKITAGAEFMAYASVTSYLQYRLQIDAVDGFFGGNITYAKTLNKNRIILRYRYIHSSAHLVDGHWDSKTMKWIDNVVPVAYGRNYMDMTLAHEVNSIALSLRYYGGFLLSTGSYTADKTIKKFGFYTGCEFAINNFFGKIFSKDSNLFFSFYLNAKGVPKYIINQNYLLGIKLGSWYDKGITIYTSYYNGGDVFSQYFRHRISRFGIGFTFDFL